MANGRKEWKQDVLARYGYCCVLCGTKGSKKNPLTIHHKLAVARGGQSNTENCVCWCTTCHRLYHKIWYLTTSDDYGNPIESGYIGNKKRHNKKKKK